MPPSKKGGFADTGHWWWVGRYPAQSKDFPKPEYRTDFEGVSLKAETGKSSIAFLSKRVEAGDLEENLEVEFRSKGI